MDRCNDNRLPDLRADTGSEVLANCQANVEQHMRPHKLAGGSATAAAMHPAAGSGQAGPARVLVRQLDWLEPPAWLLERPEYAGRHSVSSDPTGGGAQPAKQQEQPHQERPGVDCFAWRPEDVAALQQLDYLLAADSVYDDVLTEAFMRRCGTEHHAFWPMA